MDRFVVRRQIVGSVLASGDIVWPLGKYSGKSTHQQESAFAYWGGGTARPFLTAAVGVGTGAPTPQECVMGSRWSSTAKLSAYGRVIPP